MRLPISALLGLLLLAPTLIAATGDGKPDIDESTPNIDDASGTLELQADPDDAAYEIEDIDLENLPDDVCSVGIRNFRAGKETRDQLGVELWQAKIDDCKQTMDDRTVVRSVLIEAIEEGDRPVFRQTLWTFEPEPGQPVLRVLAERFDGDEWKAFRDGLATASGQLDYAELEIEPQVEAEGSQFVDAMARDLGNSGM